ncbi:cytochrome c [Motiliproteus sp. SC1-56]|uniref:cytochrome c n=1 Tax=Motiliproteus sp. SC1-56 TaxID=2799565 RepID=UPI001A8F2A05|nr:c-type cytochrome [Motiliproteus sp. SC1-56]
MRRKIQSLFYVGIFALSGALFGPAALAAGHEDQKHAQENEGKRLYNSYCFLCHGTSGRSGGVLANKLEISDAVANLAQAKYGDMENAKLEEIIAGYDRPDSLMPKWGTVLSKNEIKSIATYVKSLYPRYALINGKRVYSASCSGCHGADGTGGGPLAATLKVSDRVPDLTAEKYKKMDVSALSHAIVEYSAKEDTLPKWSAVLTEDQLTNVSSFIQQFGVTELYVYGDPERGKEIFRLNCVACHGQQGKGDGILAELMNVEMVDYTSKSQLDISDEGLIHIISMGAGQYMPRWMGELNADQIRDVAAYVRTLYQPPKM